MSRSMIVLVMLSGCLLIFGNTVQAADESVGQAIIGHWSITPNEARTKGTLIFNDNGTYERIETGKDNGSYSVKGPYKINEKQHPCAIDLCVDKCSGAGSEWTTLFGILRFLDNGQLEIQFSSSSERPEAFPQKPDLGTYLLTRKAVKE